MLSVQLGYNAVTHYADETSNDKENFISLLGDSPEMAAKRYYYPGMSAPNVWSKSIYTMYMEDQKSGSGICSRLF
uniref:Uncharacterized protein n=1 Tax=Candidozyma auris TaxID=498019 RepID=A0A0L0NUQ2_CANAR